MFLINFIYSLLINSFLFELEQSQAVEKLRVRVYYETLCPDSKQFIKSQLYPLLLKGGDQHLDVEFIPYGKATVSQMTIGQMTMEP